MDLIKSADSQYEEYENLLLERDQVLKDANSIWICYIKTFGQLISEVYEQKLECVKCKKTISYYQAALNHGGTVDPDAMQEYLDREMASYYVNLRRMQDENEQCAAAKISSAYEVQQAKTIYRRLARRLHPDINPETDRTEGLKELWNRIVTAYEMNDVKALSELEVLTRRALQELGTGDFKVEIPDIRERIGELKDEICAITHTEPYTHRTLLEDPAAVEQKRAALTEELETYRNYRKELEGVIRRMIQSGGIRFQWEMN